MTQSSTTSLILNATEQAISKMPAGSILCSGKAFEIAQGIASQLVTDDASDLTDKEKRRKVMSILHDAYPAARDLVAQQLHGMTFEGVVDIIKDARESFQGTRELAITPKPTLSYTGECEALEPWNLLSNAIHAHLAGKEAKTKSNWTEADEALSDKLEAAKQMLHFICQNEVKLADITGQPFNGKLTHQTRPMRLS
jgi:hypothetical protein